MKKFEGKVRQMCHSRCSLVQGFYTKLYRKSVVPESSIALTSISMKLGTLVHDAHGYNHNERTTWFLLHCTCVSQPGRSIVRENTCVFSLPGRETQCKRNPFGCDCDGSPQCLPLRIEHCLFGGLSFSMLMATKPCACLVASDF